MLASSILDYSVYQDGLLMVNGTRKSTKVYIYTDLLLLTSASADRSNSTEMIFL